MTTVAYKDGVLATDSLAISSHKIQGNATKIMETDNGWFAIAGHLVDFQPIVQLYEDIVASGEEHPKDWPRIEHCHMPPFGSTVVFVPFGKDSQAQLIFIDEVGAMRIEAIEKDFIAIGSGSPFALGAMAHGATAEESVQCAMMLDENTGGDIVVIDVNEAYQSEENAATSQAVVEDFLKTQSKKQTAENLGMTKSEVKAHLKSVAEALSEE